MQLVVYLVAGDRPTFMKIAPLYRAALKYPAVRCRIVHTGQHYDYEMSQGFFDDLEVPPPHFFLNIGPGSHSRQTGRIMAEFEEVCTVARPDLVMVVGDANSTLACSLVAQQLGIAVVHVEAGLRSFDRAMPEEINRLTTDAISDYFFVTEPSGMENLIREGQPVENIHHTGPVMIDNLFHQLKMLKNEPTAAFPSAQLKADHPDFLFLSLHHSTSVDCRQTLSGIVEALNQIAEDRPIFFPVHPRIRQQLDAFELRLSKHIFTLPPLGYLESLNLWKDAAAVLTDSDGLQEETSALGIPCITLRSNTKRPITVDIGTNTLGGNEKSGILDAYRRTVKGRRTDYWPPEKWDGRAAERIWRLLVLRAQHSEQATIAC